MKIIVEGRWNAAFSFNRKGRYQEETEENDFTMKL